MEEIKECKLIMAVLIIIIVLMLIYWFPIVNDYALNHRGSYKPWWSP